MSTKRSRCSAGKRAAFVKRTTGLEPATFGLGNLERTCSDHALAGFADVSHAQSRSVSPNWEHAWNTRTRGAGQTPPLGKPSRTPCRPAWRAMQPVTTPSTLTALSKPHPEFHAGRREATPPAPRRTYPAAKLCSTPPPCSRLHGPAKPASRPATAQLPKTSRTTLADGQRPPPSAPAPLPTPRCNGFATSHRTTATGRSARATPASPQAPAHASSAARSRPDGRPCSTRRRRPCRCAAACRRRSRGTRPR